MRILLLCVVLAGGIQTAASPSLRYPFARRDLVVENLHGVPVADPYRWLEQTDSAEALNWLREEDRLASAWLTRGATRARIERRLTRFAQGVQVGVPWREAGRLFYEMSGGPDEQPVLYVQRDVDTTPSVVVDPNRISRSGSVAFRDYTVSPDGRWVAYAEAQGGSDAAETRVRDVATGRLSPDVVRGVLGSVCWTHDAHGFFYVASSKGSATTTSAAGIDKQFAYHILGEAQALDRRIGRWTDNYRWGYCMLSDDGRYAIAVMERGGESELSTIDLASADKPAVASPLVQRLGGGHAYTPIGTIDGRLFVTTDHDAPRRRVVALNLDDPAATTREIVPESDDVIEEAALTSDRLVVHYLSDVKSRLRLFTTGGRPAGEVALPGIGSIGWGLSARSSKSDFFYSFTSFLEPKTVYRYDGARSTPFHAQATPAETSAFETRQVFYRSKDGTQVPMFITARKGMRLDGQNPTLLTAYGGYGATLTPTFQSDVLAWLQLGGVYALANIRGGGEYGEAWHRAGMLDRKQTSFDDFVAAAEHLVTARVASSGKLAIYGHSNGGLLVGAALTQRPDLFAVAVANAGHYDMLRYHRFTVGAGWIPEYGSPDDANAFEYLRAYSPLHNVHTGTCYPATLLLAADRDDRVVPSHSYKFAAALQAAQACDRPILLRVAHQASHSYASKNARIAELSDMWNFIASQLKVTVTD